jgi:hypothetical protein
MGALERSVEGGQELFVQEANRQLARVLRSELFKGRKNSFELSRRGLELAITRAGIVKAGRWYSDNKVDGVIRYLINKGAIEYEASDHSSGEGPHDIPGKYFRIREARRPGQFYEVSEVMGDD